MGTFTDMIGVDEDTKEITVTKRPSTPRHPEQGVFDALAGSGVPIDDITLGPGHDDGDERPA